MSDIVATALVSLSMMTQLIVQPEGNYEYYSDHCTVTRHYYKFLKGEETSTNPVATIFAWTGGLRKRGQLDGIAELAAFADKLDRATIDTIEEGYMTGDLALIYKGDKQVKKLNTVDFLKEIAKKL